MSNVKLWQDLDEYKDDEDLYADDDLSIEDDKGDYYDDLADEYNDDVSVCPQCKSVIEDEFYDFLSCSICGWTSEK